MFSPQLFTDSNGPARDNAIAEKTGGGTEGLITGPIIDSMESPLAICSTGPMERKGVMKK